ncbi:glycosyltransferase [Bizionia sp. M204]|nr:glycosyltransferase [Bizionia sp. M204]
MVFLTFNIMDNSTSDYFITLSNKLSERQQVVVITGKIRNTKVSLRDNIIVLKWPTKHPVTAKDFWFLYKLVQKHKPTLMISMFSFVNVFLIVGWLLRVPNRVAWIRTLSSQYEQKSYKVFRKSLIYKLATNVIANSNATRKDIVDFFNIPENKVFVLPNSVKDYGLLLKEVSTDKLKLLYVGRLHPSKGVDVLIWAFSKLLNKFPNLRLDIIGQGEILQELISQTHSLGISDYVTFLGVKDKETVLRAYKESYCTIIPSYSEAFGYTVIEAMSVGTCVIGADNTGIKEIIHHEKTGLLFETGNSVDLENQLARVITEPQFRNTICANGYKRFLNFYENSVAIDRDFNFFLSLQK